jgi:type I restriction enzyme S subunit
MKAGWAIKELRAVSAINYGYTESASSEPVGPRFLRITDIQDDYVDWDSVPYCKIESADVAKYRLESGDIVFARTGATTGKSFLVNEPPDAVFASYLIRLRLLDGNLLPEFVSLFFQTAGYWKSIKDGSSGSAQGGFNASKLGALSIPIPSLSEQQRIVGILDEAFDGIATAKANAEKNLHNARALFESHLQSAFTQRGKGWVEKPLAELCDIKHGFAFKSEFFTSEGDYVVLTPGNFYESGGYRDRGEKQKYYSGEIPRGFILDKGDLLVAMTEQAAGLLGSPILVPESDKFLHNQRLGLVTKKPGVPWTNEFFFHVFNTKTVRKEIHDSASGVKVRHTSPTKIGEVMVSFPTAVSEQRAIVSKLADLREETQRLESIYQQKLAALDKLKKSLLHQAFNGEL